MPVWIPFLSKVAIEVDVGETLPYYLITLITLGNKLKPTLLPYQVA